MSEEERKFLEVRGLAKSFGTGDTKQDVLKGLDFTVGKGEFCVLLGPSGSGKSTLLNILGGIDNADSGEIFINGDRLSKMDEKSLTRYRRKHLGYVFQMYNLIPNLNVKENIETGAYTGNGPMINSDFLNAYDNKKDSIAAMLRYLEEKGIGRKGVQYKMKDWAFNRQRYLEGDITAYRAGQRKVRQYDNNGHAQRSYKTYGGSCNKAPRRKDTPRRPQYREDKSRGPRMVRRWRYE